MNNIEQLCITAESYETAYKVKIVKSNIGYLYTGEFENSIPAQSVKMKAAVILNWYLRPGRYLKIH